MEYLLYSVEIILPIVILIFIGYLLQHLKIFNDEFLKVANNLTFKVFFPIMLFYNIFSKDNIIESINYKLIIYLISIVTIIYLILLFIMPKIVKERKRTGVMIQGSFRSNFLLFGIPLSGAEGKLTASIVAGIYVPFINVLSTITLYIFSDDENKSVKKAIISSLTNPLFLGGMLGIIFGIFRGFVGFNIPNIIDKPIKQIVDLATPLAFILLGGGLRFKNLFKNIKYSLSSSLIKTVVIPAIIVPIATIIGFGRIDLTAIVAAAGTPNAVSSYVMARNYHADYELAGELVVLSTVISIFTLFILLTITMSLGLINPPV